MRSSATLLRLFRTSSGHLPRARNISKAPSPFNAYRPLPLSSRAGSLYAYNSRRYNSSSSDAADINPRPLTDRVPNASVDAANAEQNAARRLRNQLIVSYSLANPVSSLEDILGTKGMKVTKGVLNDDLEIWEDGSVYKAGSNKEGVDISSDVSPKETP
uniref:ATP-dependent DNA helicase II subunit 1 n=1 Tax=Talaromyces marneffei PM1 TaxID=1077442 RepID=A0A093VI14_TALMA